MSYISDFIAAQNALHDRQDKAVKGLTEDVATLNATIEKLQNTPGGITLEDQQLLDAIQERAGAIADKLDALDALTEPPIVPPVEPVDPPVG